MKTITIEALVAAAVLITWLCVLGMLRMRDPFQRMHYIAPPASLSVLFIMLAIFLQDGLKPESFKALFTALVLVGMNTVVTHAAARAFRMAEAKGWHPAKGEEVPVKATDEPDVAEPAS